MSNLKADTILRGRYRITGLIGKGGMGAVYLADDQRLKGRQCAIKEQLVLDRDSELAETVRLQFEQEASILARLDHPALPKVSDYFSLEDNSRDYLVMDYVPGQDLEQLLKAARREKRFLAEETVLSWVFQLCEVLDYLHSRQPMVLHRDIKPANIKLTPDKRVKLVDFGLAKPFDPSDPRTITGLQGLGSLPYTPLEQYVGDMNHTDARTDLYALGATCYHLLTGKTCPSAHDRFLDESVLPPPQAHNPNLSPHISEAIMWAMQLHPKDRPPSISVWRQALQRETALPQTDSLTPERTQSVTLDPLSPESPSNWPTALWENRILLALAGLALGLALWISLI